MISESCLEFKSIISNFISHVEHKHTSTIDTFAKAPGKMYSIKIPIKKLPVAVRELYRFNIFFVFRMHPRTDMKM